MRVNFQLYGALQRIVQGSGRVKALLLVVMTLLILSLTLTAPAHAQSRPAQEKLILAFGDSLTAGYGLKPAEAFPVQLQAALRKQGKAVRVHGAGVSGDTTAQGKGRLNWVLKSLKRKPDLVIVQLGGNDMLRGIDPKVTQANLSAILTELKRQKIPVLLAGMLASPNMGKDYRTRFDALYPALAKQHRVRLYPFFLKGVTGNRALLIKDNIHPNARGVGTVVRGILPDVNAMLR